MLVLEEVQEPSSEVELIQPQVVCYWERECLAQGTLYITARMVVWISNRNRKGFRLPFPSISVHAASGSSDDFPEPCLFLVIDVSKTEIDYQPDGMGTDGEDENDEDIIKTAAIRFVPSDPSAIQPLFETMNICQEKNPDENDAASSEECDDEECEMEPRSNGAGGLEGEGGEGSHQWFTADSSQEIELSEQGRANLQQMLGGLGGGDTTPAATGNSSAGAGSSIEHLHISQQHPPGGSSGETNPAPKTDDAMDQG